MWDITYVFSPNYVMAWTGVLKIEYDYMISVMMDLILPSVFGTFPKEFPWKHPIAIAHAWRT